MLTIKPRSLRERCAVLLAAALALLHAACSDVSPSPTPTPVVTPVERVLVSGVVAKPSTAFEVDFAGPNGARLVWRQADGMRRWDIPTFIDAQRGGSFTLETQFDDGGVAASVEECIWSSTTHAGTLFAGCGDGAPARGFAAGARDLLGLTSTGTYDGPIIAGQATTCFVVEGPVIDGSLCVGRESRVPLRIDLVGSSPDRTVYLVAQRVLPLAGFPRYPNHGFEGQATAIGLGLPTLTTGSSESTP
jgi:hypothetical protein